MKLCPKCGTKALKMTEMRPRSNGVPANRMRRRCLNCGHGETTYEITADQMKQFEDLLRLDAAVAAYMQVAKPDSCTSCIHWTRHGCSMGIPEAGGNFANDCSLFENETT